MGVRVKALIAGILRYIIGVFPSQEFLLLIIVILHRNSVVQTPDITTLSLYSAVYWTKTLFLRKTHVTTVDELQFHGGKDQP